MRARKTPRYQGKITTWKDDQGYGFITQNGGGPTVFIHIKSFANRAIRPAENDIVTYELTTNEEGRPRAENVAFVRDPVALQSSPEIRARSLVFAVSFLGLVAALVSIGRLPAPVFGLYLGMSVFAFILYAYDKSAARAKRWRISENGLHLLGLIGGWPGARLAQRILRHKSKKRSFQNAFWVTVVVNCFALAWVMSLRL